MKVLSCWGRMEGMAVLADARPRLRWRMLVGSRRWGLVLFHDPQAQRPQSGEVSDHAD